MSYDISAYAQPKMLPIPSLDDNSMLPPPPGLPWPPPGFPKPPAAPPPATQAPPPGTTSDKLICDPFFGGCINKETGETLSSATPWSAIFNFIKDPRNILWAFVAFMILGAGLLMLVLPSAVSVAQSAVGTAEDVARIRSAPSRVASALRGPKKESRPSSSKVVPMRRKAS